MQVSQANDVKIYNLSAGKSLPEWMSQGARRKLEKKNFDVRRRIQLIQGFDMPDMSSTVNISPDGRYVFATGAYKPFVKCFDLSDLSLKFERGLDADVIKLCIISEDYSKFILLQEERYLEIHAAFGRYFRMRMPRFGRDMSFSKECSDLYLVGAGSDIYRLNLEQGEWLAPLQTASASLNCCQFSEQHQLFVCGTVDGHVEAWDHRDKSRAGRLDCFPPLASELSDGFEITSIKFRDALHFGVGTSSGHVLIYDIRSSKPLLVKDHNNGIPIKKIDFVRREDDNLVMSMDSRVLKTWYEHNGKPFAAIETETQLTDFTRFPDSGLIFFANEAPRMLQYFVPAIGTAPKWCSFLETITEELEENSQPTVYDDFKFVTKKELEDIGLSHMIGSNLLRAYMHGFFIDNRLYSKALMLTQPFAFDKYKDRKIKDMVLEEREMNVVKKGVKLPKVNRDLALRLQQESSKTVEDTNGRKAKSMKKKSEAATTILADDRFKKLFESADFEVDETDEQYQRTAKQAAWKNANASATVEEEEDSNASEASDQGEDEEQTEFLDDDDDAPMDGDIADSDLESVASESEEDENDTKKQKAKEKAERILRKREKYLLTKEARKLEKEMRLLNKPSKFVLHEIGDGETISKFMDENVAEIGEDETSLATRKKKLVRKQRKQKVEETPFGGRSMSFTIAKKGNSDKAEKEKQRKKEHAQERKEAVRKTTKNINKEMGIGTKSKRGGRR